MDKVLGIEARMTSLSKRSAPSSQEAHEERVSCDYEKRQESAMDMDEEKAIGLDGTEYPALQEEEVEPYARGRSQRRPSHDDRSLHIVRSHHSRAGGDG